MGCCIIYPLLVGVCVGILEGLHLAGRKGRDKSVGALAGVMYLVCLGIDGHIYRLIVVIIYCIVAPVSFR